MVRSRAALRSALLDLLATTPLEQVTVRGITAKAGIGYATFFRHYPTKEALLDEAVADQIRRLVEMSLPLLDGADRAGSCRALCAYVQEHQAVWHRLLAGGAAPTLREQFISIATQISANRDDINKSVPQDLGIRFAVSGILDILSWWIRREDDVPPEKVARLIEHLVIIPTLQEF